MPSVTTSLSINFQSPAATGEGGSFAAEIDTRPLGLNKGRSSFIPGDSVYILLYAGSLVSNIQATKSAGAMVQASSIVVDQEEQISLANGREFTTRYPVTGSYSITWYGTNPGTVTKNGDQKFNVPNEAVAVGVIKYQSTARVFILSGVIYPAAIVVFTGETP